VTAELHVLKLFVVTAVRLFLVHTGSDLPLPSSVNLNIAQIYSVYFTVFVWHGVWLSTGTFLL